MIRLHQTMRRMGDNVVRKAPWAPWAYLAITVWCGLVAWANEHSGIALGAVVLAVLYAYAFGARRRLRKEGPRQ